MAGTVVKPVSSGVVGTPITDHPIAHVASAAAAGLICTPDQLVDGLALAFDYGERVAAGKDAADMLSINVPLHLKLRKIYGFFIITFSSATDYGALFRLKFFKGDRQIGAVDTGYGLSQNSGVLAKSLPQLLVSDSDPTVRGSDDLSLSLAGAYNATKVLRPFTVDLECDKIVLGLSPGMAPVNLTSVDRLWLGCVSN